MTISEFLGLFPKVVSKGKEQWDVQCPAHSDNKPSLSVSVGANEKIIFKCQAGCTLEEVIGALGLTKADLFNDGKEYKPPVAKPEKYKDLDISEWYDYQDANGRVVYSVARCEKVVDGKKVKEFPAWHNGKWTLEGVERVPYRLPKVLKSDVVWIVEGEKDVHSLEALGITATTNPGGACKWKEDYGKYFNDKQTVVICPDNDEPGEKHAAEVRSFLKNIVADIRIVKLAGLKPKGDVTDWLVGKDTDTAKAELLSYGKPFTGYVSIEDLKPKIQTLWKEGVKKGASPGWPTLADYWRLRKKEWTLVTGIPGHGKSSFLDAVMINLAAEGWRWAVFSAENLPLERHFVSLAEKYIGKPFDDGPTMRIESDELIEAVRYLNEHFVFISPKEDRESVEEILRICDDMMQAGRKLDGIVIDPWNELEHARPAHMTETDYISFALKKLRRFARTHEIHIIVVAHPAKLQRDQNGKYPVPSLYDVAGSAHWRNKVDNGIVVWRDPHDPEHKTEIHIQKIRFREVGKVGQVDLKYDTLTGRFMDLKTGISHVPVKRQPKKIVCNDPPMFNSGSKVDGVPF